jgi:hypothetical protein
MNKSNIKLYFRLEIIGSTETRKLDYITENTL